MEIKLKPPIVNITYAVLALLVLTSAAGIINIFQQGAINENSSLYNASTSILMLIAGALSIFYLYKQKPLGRLISLFVVGIQAILTISAGIYIFIANANVGPAILIPSLSFGLPLLFLAYKIFSSKPLKEYLINT